MKIPIELTKREYLSLLTVVEIADWVLHAFSIREPAETKRYRDLEQKLFGYAEGFGMADLVEKDPKTGHGYPTAEFEDQSPGMEFIELFEDDTFWDELIERLATRDAVRESGEDEWGKLSYLERLRRKDSRVERYALEFENHGIERIEIVGSEVRPHD
jgi:hypothetical protein